MSQLNRVYDVFAIGKHWATETVFRRCSEKKIFLAYNFIKKETLAQEFSSEFWEISKNIFFTEHLRTTASGYRRLTASTASFLKSI